MNNKLFAAVVALLFLTTAVGCSDDPETYQVTSKDCMVKSATLGTLKRTIHTTTEKGEDSTYTVTVTGSLYPLSIDQVNNRIFNADSLPYGTDISKVVFSSFVSTGWNGIATLHTNTDSAFTASDSTDFTVPRKISVYTADGLRRRTYTVTIVAHRQEGDAWQWQHIGRDNTLAAVEQARLKAVGDSLYLWGTANGAPVVCKAATSHASRWLRVTPNRSIDPQSVQVMNGTFYAIADSTVMRATDGATWTETGSTMKFGTLIASGSKQIFAINGNNIYSSSDGISWTLSDAARPELLTANEYAAQLIPSPIDATFEDVLLLAAGNTETNVWKKNIDLTGEYDLAWNFYPRQQDAFPCPLLSDMQLFAYDGRTLLTGKTPEGDMAPLYVSADNGRTWRTSPDYTLPTDASATGRAVTADKDHYIYVVGTGTGNIWRGRMNRLGWEK